MPNNQPPNPLQLYRLEDYLFETVGPQFHEVGCLSAIEFFCIVIWKANRAKSRIANRLLSKDRMKRKVLDPIIQDLTTSIRNAATTKDRLCILIESWGFRLPMASAILTVLYPDECTVYDVRVCEQLGAFHGLESKTRFETLWNGYEDFVEAVRAAVPGDIPLRDKDRILWGRSFYQGLESDLANCFFNEK